jgi:DHA1 family tetracycline resistance protein-like MFS transporter
MKNPLIIIFATVTLDAAGIGLSWPIFPALLRSVGHADDLSWHFGAYLALYALMQFLFAPVLGALSDRHGRKPILMLSLAGAAVDYLFMALAPSLALLFVGRAIAGMTAASTAVASAAITDLTDESERTRRFAQMSACFGIGFIAGPAIGGMLGEYSVRLPFVAAAALNAANLIMTMLFLPETRRANQPAEAHSLWPISSFRWLFGFRLILPFILVYFIMAIVGEVGGTVWVLYGTDKFHWSPMTTGLSLTAFGFFHAVAQAFIAGPISERWGEKYAMLISMLSDSVAYISIALVSQGWMAFALTPVFCLGSIGAPALQSLLTARVSQDEQGRLQGLLSSITSLATIVGPLAISMVYFASREIFPGLVWVLGAALLLICLPMIFARQEKSAETA